MAKTGPVKVNGHPAHVDRLAPGMWRAWGTGNGQYVATLIQQVQRPVDVVVVPVNVGKGVGVALFRGGDRLAYSIRDRRVAHR